MLRLIATALAAAAPAGPIATVPENVPIGAHGRWVAWSTPVEGGYRLMTARDGEVLSPPVALRDKPFDLDLGTDARGRTVATYTRCATSARCSVRVLDLASGTESAPNVPGGGERLPSMWRGRIAFARLAASSKAVDQVMLWSPGRSLRTLRHGPVDRCVPRDRCRDGDIFGVVSGLDLGRRFVAFGWSYYGPRVIGHGGSQVRADRISDGRAFVLGSAFIGEACTGGTDSVDDSSPSVAGGDVWFARRTSACYRYRSWVVRTRPGGGGAMGRFPGDLLRFVKTETAGVGLVTTRPSGENHVDCEPPSPCEIRRIDLPRLDRRAPKPAGAFY